MCHFTIFKICVRISARVLDEFLSLSDNKKDVVFTKKILLFLLNPPILMLYIDEWVHFSQIILNLEMILR